MPGQSGLQAKLERTCHYGNGGLSAGLSSRVKPPISFSS